MAASKKNADTKTTGQKKNGQSKATKAAGPKKGTKTTPGKKSGTSTPSGKGVNKAATLPATTAPTPAEVDAVAESGRSSAEKVAESGPSAKERKAHGDPVYMVGVGASAGGLEALQTFFSHMPDDTGMAFVVVQHLSPDYKSLMDELLAKHTDMTIHKVEDGMRVEPNTIYLLPPKNLMYIQDNVLILTEQGPRNTLNLPIDIFFRSLAEDQGEHAVGVVLSGTGSDGTRGVRAIKEAGGVVVVQAEETAKFDGMPRSAIATGLADMVLPPERMPEELVNFISHPYANRREAPEIGSEEDALTAILATIRKSFDVDFSSYKPNTVVRRIQRRMGIVQVHTLDEYSRYLERNQKETNALYKDLLIGVTKFFRDGEAFEAVQSKVIARIIKSVRERGDKEIRVWCAGCATGEEAYSLAILFQEQMAQEKGGLELKIFATDIDKEALEFASYGMYPDSVAADVDVDYLGKYFEKKKGGYQINRSTRGMVIFAQQNLIKDPPFTKIDMVSCRNMLIYLQPSLQRRVLATFNYAIRQDGYLFLGSSEAIGDMTSVFEPVDSKQKIYRHLVQGTVLPATSAPHYTASDYSRTVPLGMQFSERRNKSLNEGQEAYYQNLLDDVVLALIVINEDREMVQSFGQPGIFLNFPRGRATLDLLNLLPRELSLAVSSALHRVRKGTKPAIFKNIRVRMDDEPQAVDLRVNALPVTQEQAQLYSILIQQSAMPPRGDAEEHAYSEEADVDQRIIDLEQEVQFTKENLQATVEELQTSNEELQATNEELMAANEELQSTNEELQSVNEELNTVNTEYQEKIAELTELNNDMNNLMASTEIGTIFLDSELCIRKFTPSATKEIRLLDQDIGRPISDFSSHILGNVENDARRVLVEQEPTEKVVKSRDDVWYSLRFLPYRNEQDQVEGVVITLINITTLKLSEKAFKESVIIYKAFMENAISLAYVKDVYGRYVDLNRNTERFFGEKKSKVIGHTDYDFMDSASARKRAHHHEEVVDSLKTVSFNEVLTIDGDEREFTTVKFPIFDEESKELIYVGCITFDPSCDI